MYNLKIVYIEYIKIKQVNRGSGRYPIEKYTKWHEQIFRKRENTHGPKKLRKDSIIITSYKKNLNENFNVLSLLTHKSC